LAEYESLVDGPSPQTSESIVARRRGDVQDAVWPAAYTTPRHEKAVARHLEVREVEHFLPLYKAPRKWKNGCKVEVECPVFPNYLFVHIDRAQSSQVLGVPGVIAFAGSGKLPVAIPDNEIDWLRNELPRRKFEPHPYLLVGSRVRIKSGPLVGMNGVLTRKKSGLRVVLSIDLIRQSVAVEVDSDEIEICSS
jgi:transcription antitermination factor NusG